MKDRTPVAGYTRDRILAASAIGFPLEHLPSFAEARPGYVRCKVCREEFTDDQWARGLGVCPGVTP